MSVVEDPLLKVQDAELLLNDRGGGSGVASSHGSGTPSHGSGSGSGRASNPHYGGNMLTVTDTPDWAAGGGGGNSPAGGTSPTGKGLLLITS